MSEQTYRYHISDCKKYARCPRLFVYSQNEDKETFRPFVRLDEEVTELAAQMLGIPAESRFTGKRGDSPDLALAALHEKEWLIKARFEAGQLRVKVPFLHRQESGWDLYFLFIGLYPHADDLQFYCDTAWVLEENDIALNDIYIIHLNAGYVREKELDAHQLFTVSDRFYNSRNHPSALIRDLIFREMKDLTGMLSSMDACSLDSMSAPIRTSRCSSRQKCRYYDRCFPFEKEEPDNSIVTLIASQHKHAMKGEGIRFLKEADPARIEGSRQQYAQIMADRGTGLFCDRLALRSWLGRIHYPVTFIDFEWERFAIPPYEGMRPYDVLPFEYSMHILKEDGTMEHTVYLSVHDDRRSLAESLLKDAAPSGSVIAYNAEGAEKIRIRELADLYPDLAEGLLDLNERMEDLQLPFESGIVYDTRMKGFWSLKVIMGMMNDASYKDLDIQQGMDAVFEWRSLDQNEEVENSEKIIEELKAYCGMDTYAMTVVYAWLKKLASEQPLYSNI